MPATALTMAQREEISRGLVDNDTFTAIAGRIGRHKSTVSREVARHGRHGAYRACVWPTRPPRTLCGGPKGRKLATNDRLRDEVESRLANKHSPEQIANRLAAEFPDDQAMRVSHETIYQELYLQARGSLRAELTEARRTGRARRRPKGPKPGRGTRGKLTDVVEIADRPAEVDDRAVPGHWEGDLILGRSGRSQVATLVERTSRLVTLVALPDNRKAATVRDALAAKVTDLPETLVRSLTWDRGKEMARHVDFTVATGVDIYFCDPHAPWQRGTNENTNGLLRQYLPRKMDLSQVSKARLDAIADELNGRPQQTLGWMTPSEKFTEFVAPTG